MKHACLRLEYMGKSYLSAPGGNIYDGAHYIEETELGNKERRIKRQKERRTVTLKHHQFKVRKTLDRAEG